jgi:VanZ family protein
MKLFGFFVFFVLAILAVRRARWAYVLFVILGLLYFPASMGFRVEPRACYLAVDLPFAIQSLSNYGHIVLYCLFFLMTTRQFRSSGWSSWGWSFGLTTAMGIAVEIAEGLSGHHHCKAIDLIPNFIGTLLGLMVVVLASATLGRRSGSNGLSE